MNATRSLLWSVAALGALMPSEAFPQIFPAGCDVPAGFVSVTKRSELPAALQEKLKGGAMPGERWNAGDFGPPGFGAIFIWHGKGLWIMEVGRGGIAMVVNVLAYRVSTDGKTAQDVTLPLVDPRRFAPCAEARRNAGL